MEIDKILEFFFLRKEKYPLNRLNYLENFNQGDRGKLFVDLSSKRIEIDRNTSQLYSRDEYIRRIGREVRKRRFFRWDKRIQIRRINVLLRAFLM